MPSPPALKPKPFAADDAAPAAVLHLACFAHDPWPAHAFVKLLESGAEGFIVVNAVSAAIGLILCRAAADEAEILTFAVLPAYRQKGIGQILLQTAIESLGSQEIDRIFLEVAKNNQAAISLYSNAGFSIVGDRNRYYSGPNGITDAYIMLKQLHL